MQTIEQIRRRLGNDPRALQKFDASEPATALSITIAKIGAIAFGVYEAGNLATMGAMALKASIQPKPLNPPSATIVVPGGEGLEPTLRSLLEQPFVSDKTHDVEILVVDAEQDNSLLTIQQLKSEFDVRINHTTSNRGRLSQYTWGIEKAEGDVVALASPGLTYSRHWLHDLLSHFSDPDVVAVNGASISPFGLIGGSGYKSLFRGIFKSPITLGNVALRKVSYISSERINIHLNERMVTAVKGEVHDLSRRLRRNGKIVQSYGALAFGSPRLVRRPLEVPVSIEPLIHIKPSESNPNDYPAGD